MQVQCLECGFCGAFDSARAPDHPFTIKCPKCASLIQMPGKAGTAPVNQARQAPPPQPSDASQQSVKRIDALLISMVEMKASDLHVCSNCHPMVRHDGEMSPVPQWPVLSSSEIETMLWEISPPRNKEQFEERHDTDFAYEITGLSRFRVNVFMDRKGIGAVFRVIPSKIITVEDLNLSKEILELCKLPKGLVLVTGPTGSGKSTTLCALIDYINRTRKDHMITIEDPIEFVHENKECLINQREVHEHTSSFKTALRAALREDPDIVYIGEMRDLETISIAIETAETGHLVFGTLHTSTAPSTIDRIIDQFPGDKQEQIRMMLSESLRGVICQMLCKKTGGGRVAAMEVLIVTPSVSNLIRERKTFQIQSVLQTGKNLGMCTMNDSFLELVKSKKVTPQEAYDKALDKPNLVSLFEKNSINTSWVGR
ncbi:MAG: PilT/PilU family type 4a pilus ATPase [Chitinispirillales bacterium]|nr:PilT/PilU family type 4a pilus ATPase [Chitinispirillales bacterium]